MNDSQTSDYLEIIQSLLATRQSKKEWEQAPEIINLTIKAMARLLEVHDESFVQHKTLINQQSLKLKELELRLGNKLGKKDIESEVITIMNNLQIARREEDSVSQYQKLIKQSRYSRGGNSNPTVEELKTIAEIIAEKRIEQTNNELKSRFANQQIQIQQKITTLKEEVKNRMIQIQRERREWVDECRQVHSRIEQSHVRLSYTQNDDKISQLQHSNRRVSEGLGHLITHLQQNFPTKQQVNLLIEREKEKEKEKKSASKPKPKEFDRSKPKDELAELHKSVQVMINKSNEDKRQWNDFKQGIMKQLGKTVKIETVNNLIDNFQKDMLEKYQSITALVNKQETKLHSFSKTHDTYSKQIMTKSEKRAQKKHSPSKSIDSIQNSLIRLEKTILDKQNNQIRKIEGEVDHRIKQYDDKLIKQLDRREKYLCEVIEQTYNQQLQTKIPEDSLDFKTSIKRLFETNLICRYLYIGTKQCKKETCISWQKESLNNIVQNFVWKRDSSIVLLSTPGLYKVQVGLFGSIQSQSVLMLNGDPFAQIPKPINGRSTGIKVRGSSFSEILLLPGKSKISVRVNQNFYGQAYLSIEKL